jgi:hypothetical protein
LASSGTRLPGEEITGQSLGSAALTTHLQNAENDETKGDVVNAMKEYQTVLDSQPSQVQALTGEGWLLAETGEPSLLQRGLTMLVSAENVQADYAPAHLYRGLALLSEDDYSDSVPELQWYLANHPDPQLVSTVRTALSRAKTGQAAASGAGTGQSGQSGR